MSVCTALLAASVAVTGVQAGTSEKLAIGAAKSGYEALTSGKVKVAIAKYSQAIETRKLPPENLARALLNRALAHQSGGQYNAAISDYSTALRVDSLSAKMRAVALYNRGLAYQKQSKNPQAIEDFTNALMLDRNFPEAFYSRGNTLRASGQYLFALSDYDKALRAGHSEPNLPLYGKAVVYEALHRPDNARKSLMRAIAAKPDFEPAKLKLAQLAGQTKIGARKVSANEIAMALRSKTIITSSVLKPKADLVVRKTNLPDPISPPSTLSGKKAKVVARLKPEHKSTESKLPLPPVSPAILAAAHSKQDVKVPAAKVVTRLVKQQKLAKVTKASGWMVQLSSQRKEGKAWDVWKKMTRKHGKLLANQHAIVQEADLGTRGVFYRLRVNGLSNKSSAAKLCRGLKRGGTSCYVSKAQG